MLDAIEAADFFLALSTHDQADLLHELGPERSRPWMRLLAPDDAADLVQALPAEQRERFMALLDPATRGEVTALLAYAEDAAGGVMNPRYMRLRPDISVEVAIRYLRRQAIRGIEVIDYAYVLGQDLPLLGVVSFRELFAAPPEKLVQEIMHTDLVTVTEETDQEAVAHLFAEEGLLAIPVVDAEGRMKGVVTADDVVGVVQEEATEDIQKIGGSEALDEPYLQIGFSDMVRKRGRLAGGAVHRRDAHGHRHGLLREGDRPGRHPRAVRAAHHQQRRQLRLAGGDAGDPRDGPERGAPARLVAGRAARGADRAGAGPAAGRSSAWSESWCGRRSVDVYGEHYLLVALTVAGSLLGVVMFGTLAGSMLPFVLRRFGADPASASAPFVATLVDVTGLIIYFTVARLILGGTLL